MALPQAARKVVFDGLCSKRRPSPQSKLPQGAQMDALTLETAVHLVALIR
jgi:hypothetical protein